MTINEISEGAKWVAVGCSVRGASHVRNGVENQDRALVYSSVHGPEYADGQAVLRNVRAPFVVAVADGHGSARHFRSARGAKFAVEAAGKALMDLAEHGGTSSAEEWEAMLKLQAKSVFLRWRELVADDLEGDELSPEEWAIVTSKTTKSGVQADPVVAYGATLVAAVVTGSLVGIVQIGDGSAVALKADGEGYVIASEPVPVDDSLYGTTTTSLCTKNSWLQFRVAALCGEEAPPFLMLVTDGYDQSYPTREAYLRSAVDYSDLIREEEGQQAIGANLGRWLSEISEEGTGDDVSMVIVARPNALSPWRKPELVESTRESKYEGPTTVAEVAEEPMVETLSSPQNSVSEVERHLKDLKTPYGDRLWNSWHVREPWRINHGCQEDVGGLIAKNIAGVHGRVGRLRWTRGAEVPLISVLDSGPEIDLTKKAQSGLAAYGELRRTIGSRGWIVVEGIAEQFDALVGNRRGQAMSQRRVLLQSLLDDVIDDEKGVVFVVDQNASNDDEVLADIQRVVDEFDATRQV